MPAWTKRIFDVMVKKVPALPATARTLVGLAAALGPLAPAHAQTGAPPARPNILWLVSEDNTFNYVGAYGDPLARTPNIDRLAARGIVFDNFHSTAPVCAPARSSIITGRYASSLGSQHMRSTRRLPEGVRFFPEFLREAGYFCTNHAKTDYNTATPFVAAWDENGARAHWRHRRPGQPFFSVFNFEQSHESRLHRREPLLTDPARVRVPAYLPDIPEVRADIAQYYDCVSRADAALASVLAELREDGLEDDTIVFYYSDNGGAVSRSKRFLYDNGTHTAFVAMFPPRWAAVAPAAPGTHLRELVNFVDLAPTVLSLAGVPLPGQFQGRAFAGRARAAAPEFSFVLRDRMDERYDSARAVTDGRYRYIRNYYPEQPWGQHVEYQWRQASMAAWARLYRTGRLDATQRAFFEPKAAEELFDCARDPDNVRNLAALPAYRPQLERLRQALRKHQLAIRDTGLMPEPLLVEWSADDSPASVAADERRYPLARLLDLVDAWQLSTPSASALAQALRAPEPLVRYWAAVAALRNPPPAATLEPLLADEQLVVRLAAAEALLRRGDHEAAWAVVEKALNDAARPEGRLFALNLVARVPRPFPGGWRSLMERFAAAPDAAGMNNYFARLAEDLLHPDR